MNKIYLPFVIVSLFILASCSSGIKIQKTIITSGYDFTSYTKKEFLFTPEQYLKDYESIGIITIEIIPDVFKTLSYSLEGDDEWIVVRGKEQNWKVKIISPQEVLDELYSKATSMGADALVRLSFENVVHYNGDAEFFSLKATGFAIKRK